MFPHRIGIVAVLTAALGFVLPSVVLAQAISIDVDATERLHSVSPFLTGACIEDVNHEIYGGIYSQMLFGESFQEPSRQSPVKGFEAVGGQWAVQNGILNGPAGEGPKLVLQGPIIERGEVGVEVKLIGQAPGNAGLIIATNDAKVGADNFSGYEVAIDSQANRLVIGRHDHNFRLIGYEPVSVPTDQWVSLRIAIEDDAFTVFVDGKEITTIRDEHPLKAGTIGFRQWQRPAQYRNLQTQVAGKPEPIALTNNESSNEFSGQWDAVGNLSSGQLELTTDEPFVGNQSQRLIRKANDGVVGLSNRGLNRWGLTFLDNHVYEGYLWLRSDAEVKLSISAGDDDSSKRLAEQSITVATDGEWQRYDFELTPEGETQNGYFAISLQSQGHVDLGHAFLQPGPWGRYKDLPVRLDVVRGLIDQGITVLRYGGSMVDNPPNYRWKNMIGSRDRRQPYDGHWYDYSTNGWAILDFLNLCEAAGFFGIPCFSIDETPQDMLDFLQYANGDADSLWGKQRVADGHPEPYQLKYIQLGNEESVNQAYWDRYEPIARALWKQDPSLILIVGDFQFEKPIVDPFKFTGSPAGISSLSAHQKILALSKELDTEVWFDTHMWTGGPEPTSSMDSFFTYVDALEKLSEGAKHKVVVFEFNANNHRQRRALSNAEMIGRLMRDGRIPIALSANCLQPDGQNDNGWDQGLLFLNSSKVWLQPPGYVTQMVSEAYQPWVVKSNLRSLDNKPTPETLDVVATTSKDGQSVVIRLVNRGQTALPVDLNISGLKPQKSDAKIVTLAAELNAHNTADNPNHVQPQKRKVAIDARSASTRFELPPYSYSTVRVQ
ncbi:DUF1080 domain-containing protein [Stieleria sp. JC731]|uniref:family 16 glycoside hydrolase n=1 Tax=Pirellulaceae TaxID=2691357 RepID=UPI001E653DBB|nr:family 16 glycoside hydrolase [Stieleria sp. JC731]MCC9600704.1 DUF1080 domain-containing protein [Stieleria sp. JC731]